MTIIFWLLNFNHLFLQYDMSSFKWFCDIEKWENEKNE